MADILEQYIDPAFVYRFTQGPEVVQDRDDALRNGINCISLAHLAIQRLFDYKLPRELHCAEMYMDSKHFMKVDDIDEARRGDLVWFGIDKPRILPEDFTPEYKNGALVNWAEFPVKHATIHTGARNEADDPLLLHATHIEGTTAIWPLSKFSEYSRYRRLYGISRLKLAA